jgi:hypothetical protein
MNARPEQGLIDINIAKACHAMLIHEQGLDGRSALAKALPQGGFAQSARSPCIWPKSIHAQGIHRYPAEGARVLKHEFSLIALPFNGHLAMRAFILFG